MKKLMYIGALTVAFFAAKVISQQALFIKNDLLERGKRDIRQPNADQMVQNILQWLQAVYTQNSRKIRQGTLREYLPPSNTQKPRPFEPVNPGVYLPPPLVGYPPAGMTPQPAFPIETNPATGAVTGEGYPSTNDLYPSGYPSSPYPQPPFSEPPSQPPNFYTTGSQEPSTGYPTAGYPTPRYTTTGNTYGPTTGPTQGPYTYPTPSTGTTGQTQQPTTYPTQSPTVPESTPGQTTGYPSQSTGTQPAVTSGTSETPSPSQETTIAPATSPTSEHFTSPTSTSSATEETGTAAQSTEAQPKDTGSSGVAAETTVSPPTEEDLKHPPHIHDITVQCAKEMMTINIEFNRQFDGIIYSKGFYNNPECRYVKENSGQTRYSFTVSLNSCGTEFVNAFDTQGQSYLENVLVLQNEAGIQEVWDTIRSVRCLWEGNLKESLSVALSVGMLTQEIVTFSGDTAMAKLDIQLGKGPFAPPANGLVKIGEPMTLAVSVTGDAGFDIQVKDCKAKDSSGDNEVALTDDNGCVLKPKLFGAFQKTRNTGNTGASIIAYAFFNAFKFPDVMDLMIECNIELCKTDCEVCPKSDQKIEPGKRRRRDLYNNETIGEPVTMGKHLRIIVPEDLTEGETVVNVHQLEGVCMSTQNFVFSTALLVSILTTSCLFSGYLWLKNQRLRLK